MSICNAYHTRRGKGICWGTKDCDPCSCGGDESRCDFYPEVREQTKPVNTNADRIRAMSDFELAEMLDLISCGMGPEEVKTAEDWLEWVKKEAENG